MLASEGGFDGTVRFIFQPAEEWGSGALAMLEDGLDAAFPFEEIYGIHNMPGLPIGHFETRAGAVHVRGGQFRDRARGQRRPCRATAWGHEALVPPAHWSSISRLSSRAG